MTEINIIFTTKNKENAINLLKSIQRTSAFEKNKNYSLSIIIFDKTLKQKIENELENFELDTKVISLLEIKKLEKRNYDFFITANCSIKIDSIQRARIQQQVYIIEHFEKFKKSIIWQVDDDMLFGKSKLINNKHIVNYSTNYFSEIVELYLHNQNIDAIIAPSTYVPPIPSLLYCKTQLNDFFNKQYIPQNDHIPSEYHDYYSQQTINNSYSIFLSKTEEKNTIVKDILIGKPVTQISFNNCLNTELKFTKSKLLRGGNFIVFNSDIFKIPHLGFSESYSIPTRRSDMIHSNLLAEVGFKIIDVCYFSLVHNRTFNYSSIISCTKKYFSDMIGALLIQYLYKGEKEFKKRLKFHQNHIKDILKLLYKNVDKNEFQNEIEKLIDLDYKINSFDKEHFITKFEKFEQTKNQLKLKLCKLV